MKKLYGFSLDQDGNLISSQNKKNDRGGRLNEKTASANAKGMVAHATITLCAVILGFACTWQHSELDEGGGVLPIPKQEEVIEQQDVTLNLVIHDGLNQTKAGRSEPEEKYISQVHALVFSSPDGQFLYSYEADPDEDFSVATGSGNRIVRLKLQIRSQPVQIHILANAKGNQQAGIYAHWSQTADNFGAAESLSEVRNKIGFNVENKTATGAPPLNPNVTQYGSNEPIPMWGSLDNVIVSSEGLKDGSSDALLSVNTVKLLRMVAKIEIGFGVDADTHDPLLPDYELGDTIVYYNLPRTGGVIPTYPDNFIGQADNDPRYNEDNTVLIVKTPSEPPAGWGNAHRYPDIDSIRYVRSEGDLSAGGRRDTIYSFEAQANPNVDRTLKNCLVVQICKVELGQITKSSFYRIDFNQGDDPIAILRNHHYKIEIKGLSEDGYPTAREALEGDGSKWVDINCVVVGFDDSAENVIDWEPDDLDGVQ
jgi:hypothetical protein